MKELVPGFKYSLQNLLRPAETQEIQFAHTEYNELYKENVIIKDGTTDEEIVEMLIKRTEARTKGEDCDEFASILKRLNLCLRDFEDYGKRKQKESQPELEAKVK